VGWYDWLLFLHVAFVFLLGMALIGFWAAIAGAIRPFGGDSVQMARTLGKPANALVGPAALGALIFGGWLAIYVDGYALWDGWILTSIVLWVIAVAAGSMSGRTYERAAELPRAEGASLRARGLALHVVSSLGYIAILVLMIFKPGA
jgi:hypothetical protein